MAGARRVRTAFVALALSLVARPSSGQWFVSAYAGAAHTAASPLQVDVAPDIHVSLGPIAYDSHSFSVPIYYGYRVGYLVTPRVGLEGELVHLKVFANLPAGSTVQRFSISHGLNLVLANAVVRVPTSRVSSDSRLTWVARVGLGPTVPHAESTIQNSSDGHYEIGHIAEQLAGGRSPSREPCTRDWGVQTHPHQPAGGRRQWDGLGTIHDAPHRLRLRRSVLNRSIDP